MTYMESGKHIMQVGTPNGQTSGTSRTPSSTNDGVLTAAKALLRSAGYDGDAIERAFTVLGSSEGLAETERQALPITDKDVQRIAEQVAAVLPGAMQNSRPPLRVDFEGLLRCFPLKERTARRLIANKIISYERLTGEKRVRITRGKHAGTTRRGGGKLLFDVAAVDQELKRWRRGAIGD
jgi:hypothetical protein